MHITSAYASWFKTSGNRVRVLARAEGVGVAAGTHLVVHPDPCRSTHRRGSVRGHRRPAMYKTGYVLHGGGKHLRNVMAVAE